ncbi:MAG: AtpZ/AtpI family protein [Planctomycetota bacterium]|nr:AtpZ/AtpI family protein [Planctomycetota bacterium]
MTNSPDDRSPMAIAYTWAARVVTASIEMVAPGLLGYWVDQQLGTVVLFLILGLVFGTVVGILHLLSMTKSISADSNDKKDSTDGTKDQ